MNKPYFSIIIPTYNRAGFIEKTIRSLLDQTFEGFEVIVVDDGSTDNTKNVVEGINDFRLKYIYKKNGERGAARNFGAQNANGTYLNFFDSDDFAYNKHLEIAYRFIKNNETKVFHLNFDLLKGERKKKSNLKSTDQFNKLLEKGNPLSCNGVFILREIFERFKFNEDRKISGSEDYELWLRLSSQYKIDNVIDITSCIIEHDGRSVFTMSKDKLIERKLLMLDYAFKDKYVDLIYGKYRNIMQSYAYSYIALHIALSKKNRLLALKFLMKSIIINPNNILNKRFLATVKHLV